MRYIFNRLIPFIPVTILFLACIIYYSQTQEPNIASVIKASIKSPILQISIIATVIWLLPHIINRFRFSYSSKPTLFYNFSLFILIFSFMGESLLRIIYIDGETFSHSGLISDKFYQDIIENKYDKSRGPEIDNSTNTNHSQKLHIMVQGDSYTWGQGIRKDEDIYTSQLLKRIRQKKPEAQMAVLAKRGREIDGHIDQLKHWSSEIMPDVIIYQWHITDIERSRSDRPEGITPPWSIFFLHNWLIKNSFLWFFLDHQARLVLPAPSHSYADYIKESYTPGTPGWEIFRNKFEAWAKLAKKQTPNIIVFLPAQSTDDNIESAFIEMAKKMELIVLRNGDVTKQHPSSMFDRHPNPTAHKIFADNLYQICDNLMMSTNESGQR